MTWKRNQEPNPRHAVKIWFEISHRCQRAANRNWKCFSFPISDIVWCSFLFFWDFVGLEPSGTYPPRLTRLTLVCKVNRYRLVQVLQSLKKDLLGWPQGPQSPFSISFEFSFVFFFVLHASFLSQSIVCDENAYRQSQSHHAQVRLPGNHLGRQFFSMETRSARAGLKTLLLVKNGHLLRKTTAILFPWKLLESNAKIKSCSYKNGNGFLFVTDFETWPSDYFQLFVYEVYSSSD